MVTSAPRAFRIAFFGSPEFAVPTLNAIAASRHTVVGVVTQPDRPRGRGQQVTVGAVKQAALTLGLPVLQPDRLKDEGFLAALGAWQADLGVVAAYGRILPAAVLALPPLGLINVHASLLPRHRGASPVHRAVMAGDPVTGVSIMRIVQALDAGAVFATVSRPIGPDDTSPEVEADLARLGAGLLVEVVDAIADGTAAAVEQDDTLATYAAKLEKAEGEIDWSLSARCLHNRVRGLQPWPMAWTHFGTLRLIVHETRVPDGAAPSGLPPGAIVAVTAEALRVATGDVALDILTVQPEGRRPMRAREFAAGHRLVPGTYLGAAPPGSP